jgi:hypothetical protein
VVNVYSENAALDGSRVVALPQLQTISETKEALNWLFPVGFNVDCMHNNVILCSTNVIVDEWNSLIIQELNENPGHELRSEDKVQEIDDPHGYLQRMITESVLKRFQRPGVPHHCEKKRHLHGKQKRGIDEES